MITVMNSIKNPMNEVEKCLDSQLWHACAGGMVQMPPVNSKVFYFPQGHTEHAYEKIDSGVFPKIPPLILCRVAGIKYMADTETDEVYAKLRLVPLRNNDIDFDDDVFLGIDRTENQEKPPSFAKTLTQSDANNGGGFSVPRYCAETIFPRLDYAAKPPFQTILAKDVHGEVWKFRHIYRGTPRRHLLTTGWSNFVNKKKLIAGDSIVFLRADNGDIRVGIQRAKRGIGGGHESPPSGWNSLSGNCVASPYGGYSGFLREGEDKFTRKGTEGSDGFRWGMRGKGRVRAESVVEAATLAANGQPFEVVYYPQASAPEFCVKASAVRAAMRVQWCAGMRYKMAFETEDSSRISWFMGTISSVQVDDPINWPNSPWRLLQVAWDEPDLLQNVKRVSPWLIELVSNMPAVHLSPFSPPRKKFRTQPPPDFPFIGQFPFPSFPPNTLWPSSPICVSNHIPAGIQGARHAHFGLSSTDFHFNNPRVPIGNFEDNESVSCLLTMGISTQNEKKENEIQTPMFLLFGQPILTEQQISQSCSGDRNSSSDGNSEKTGSVVLLNDQPDNLSDDGSPWFKDHHQMISF